MNIINPGDVLGQQTLINFLGSLANKSNNQITGASAPGLAITGAAAVTAKNTNTFTYFTSGVLRPGKATANYSFTAGGVHDIPANALLAQERVFVYCINAAGAVTIVASNIFAGANSAPLPEYPIGNLCPFGYLRITVAAGATSFIAGTTALDNGALTCTYNDGYPVPNFLAIQ